MLDKMAAVSVSSLESELKALESGYNMIFEETKVSEHRLTHHLHSSHTSNYATIN